MDKKTLNTATLLKKQIDRCNFDIENLKAMLNEMSSEDQRIEITIRASTKPWPFFSMRNRIQGGKKSKDWDAVKQAIQSTLTERIQTLKEMETKLEQL
jgi:predicted  nucleic acid-binding Zn-ribbon protein